MLFVLNNFTKKRLITKSRELLSDENKGHASIIIINVKINVALSENASSTRYTIKIKLKLGK